MRYFEDVPQGELRRFGRYDVTREEVLDFARKYDPQPFHLDDAAAAAGIFGRLAASGWHSCAMMMRMLVDDMTATGLQSLGSPGVDELRWLKPVFPGDRLEVEQEVLEKRPSRSRPDLGSIRYRISLFNGDGVEVLRTVCWGMVRRRPNEDPDGQTRLP